MDAIRFRHYLLGGLLAGTLHVHRGCDDKTLPIGDALMELPYRLYFAGESRVWTGGIAFVDHLPSQALTKSRAYLITLRQFEQIAAQESGRDDVQLDISLLRSLGHLTSRDGSRGYDEMLYCGEKEGFPIVTFTSPPVDRPYAKPALAYLKTIASGLRDFHGLNDQEVGDYLITKPGIAGNYSEDELTEAIRQLLRVSTSGSLA